MKPWLKLVVAGWMIHLATNSLIQDSMGKTRWLSWAEANWSSAWVTVPMALVLLVWACLWIGKHKDSQDHYHVDLKTIVTIPPGMDAEDVADLVASLKSEIEINRNFKPKG